MIVVDCTVICDLLFGDSKAEQASKDLSEFDSEWISHSLIFYEVGNVGWKSLKFEDWPEKKGKAQLLQVPGLLTELVGALDSVAIFRIAAETDLTFYDASYVWLARSRGLKLRTRDKKILRKCPDVALGMA